MTTDQEYQTDDRDMDHMATAITYIAGNGDYYQQIKWVDHNGINRVSPAVRYCTSGGVSTKNPSLLLAVYDQYNAMAGKETTLDRVRSQRDRANAMLIGIACGDESIDGIDTFVALNK